MKKYLVLVLLSLAVFGCAKAPTTNTNATASCSNESDPPSINSVDVVKAQPQEVTLTRGQPGEAVVGLKITNGYHVNANPPTLSYLKPTEIELKPAEGISVEFITYPEPLIRKFGFSETPLKVYEGETSLKVRLKADKNVTPGKHNLSAKLRVQACDEKVCYAPGAIDLIVPVNVQ